MVLNVESREPKGIRSSRVALLARGFIAWNGGLDFLRLCLSALTAARPQASWAVLLPEQTLGQQVLTAAVLTKRRLTTAPWKRIDVPFRASVSQLRDSLESAETKIELLGFSDSNSRLSATLKQNEIGVLFPCLVSLGKDFPVRWVGYIPDLQHKRLPQLFSQTDRSIRDHTFGRLLSDARRTIVNSRAVAADIREFYPHGRSELVVLPFCPPLISEIHMPSSPDETLRRLELRRPFFLISNQLWVHKSHETAFDALRLVHDAGYKVSLVCTGQTHDYRQPGRFESLVRQIEQHGLTDHIRFLGLVPKAQQLSIMKASLAVIQPTLFEGGPGGGAVYDAVSTGTPAIISDIAVNKEVDIGMVSYFKAGSPKDLARVMIEYLNRPPARWNPEVTSKRIRDRQLEVGSLLLDTLEF